MQKRDRKSHDVYMEKIFKNRFLSDEDLKAKLTKQNKKRRKKEGNSGLMLDFLATTTTGW